MSMLLLSIAALLAGPILLSLFGARAALRSALDAYVAITVSGLVVLHLVPDAMHEVGVWAIVLAAVGATGPWLLEHRLSADAASRINSGSTLFALVGLAIHSVLDGAALSSIGASSEHSHAHDPSMTLAVAVILHRLPAGLLVATTGAAIAGRNAVIGLLVLMIAATVLGFAAGAPIMQALSPAAMALFTALVAGALLHVVGHAVTRDAITQHRAWTTAGVALGIASVVGLSALGG